MSELDAHGGPGGEGTGIEIERINDGVLCTFESGATVYFESRHDAAVFAANLTMVATLGADTLDEVIVSEPGVGSEDETGLEENGEGP